jgi:hypothetical protein
VSAGWPAVALSAGPGWSAGSSSAPTAGSGPRLAGPGPGCRLAPGPTYLLGRVTVASSGRALSWALVPGSRPDRRAGRARARLLLARLGDARAAQPGCWGEPCWVSGVVLGSPCPAWLCLWLA